MTERSRTDWVAGFYDENRKLIGASYEFPFTVPEGTMITLLKIFPDEILAGGKAVVFASGTVVDNK